MMDIISELNANEKNTTALQTIFAPSWVSAPSYRGTTSILWSCLVTLIACIYSAIHLNIPNTTSKFKILLLKGKWVIIALIAPEIVLFCAINQWSQARKLVSGLNELRTKSEQARQQAPQDFDIKYGFFAIMGGLRVSTKEVSDDVDTIALNSKGILELARLGYFFYINPEEIEDKSKASLLQKALVICQVLWMVTQCAARRIYGLPLTLLEIHTMVHVFCALAMYTFWFNKPLDIASSQLISGSAEFNHAIAFMLLETKMSHMASCMVIYPPYSAEISGTIDGITRLSDTVIGTKEQDPLLSSNTPLQWIDWDSTREKVIIEPGQAFKFGLGYAPRKYDRSQQLHISSKQVELWNRVASFIRKKDPPDTQLPQPFRSSGYLQRYETSRFHEALDNISSNFPRLDSDMRDSDFFLDAFFDLPILFPIIAITLPIVYGGVHLAAWHFEFPTATEHLLWKIACINIMATIPVWLLCVPLLINLYKISFSLEGFIYKFSYLFLLAYGVSRAYLVVESFISLRKVPIGVYWTPAWLQMIPHL